jgi:hypothetical protein
MTSARAIKLRVRNPKLRNPLVAAALARKAGKHQKSNKALRAQSKLQTRREMTS